MSLDRLLALGLVCFTGIIWWQAPALIYAPTTSARPPNPPSAANSQANARGSARDLLQAGAVSAAKRRLHRQLNDLIWLDSEWLIDPAAELSRLQHDCLARLNQQVDDANSQCQQQLQQALQQTLPLSTNDITLLSRYQPLADFQYFTSQHSVADFDSPLDFFEAFWQQQDAVYGQQLTSLVFAAQRDRLRFEHQVENYIEHNQDNKETRLSWYQQQIEHYQQQHGVPAYREVRDHVNRLIALTEDQAQPAAERLQQRYQLRHQWLGEQRAQRWKQREQQQLEQDGQLAPL